ncbi:hypothetical protein [Plastoroseomonas arctica]|uniref:Uncharacterized protein n=1 Tax=Plastoroseomonas arctica TaxID=1509237 RepID=A0AAF1KN65_9PROT|nr:hypothetical protein [Plastoroseomonas arctica]MBR0656234.1 hypothetical protein [Plastoroseomonas arctica]
MTVSKAILAATLVFGSMGIAQAQISPTRPDTVTTPGGTTVRPPEAVPGQSNVPPAQGTPITPGFAPAPGRDQSPQTENGSGNAPVQPGQRVAPNR